SVKDWTSPKSPMEIRQFLGLTGYYRRFNEGFSKIAKPMTKLTQKKVKFEWGDKQEAAFQLLKQKLCSAPILALPEGSEDFIVYCDASNKGLGAVLMQREKAISYASRQGAPVSTDTELGGYVREFKTGVRQDTYEIYMRLDDEQTERQLLAGRLNMLFRDRRAHAYTRQLMETEARMSREAWVRATDACDLVHGEVMSLRTTVLGQMLEIRELQAADRRRQTLISELLRIDHRISTEISELRTARQGQVTALQGQVTALQAQVTTLQGQQGLAGVHTQSELPEEADGSA
nr:putative reverse transcriptase domain-containing protein [Tanacetum cinerariifolium]